MTWHCIVYSLYCISMCIVYLCRSFVTTELVSLLDEESARTRDALDVKVRGSVAWYSWRAYGGVGVSPKYTNVWEIEYGIYKQHPYFENSEKYTANKQESRAFFTCFVLGAITVLLERNFLFRSFFGYVPKIVQNARLEKKVNSMSSSVMQPTY